MANAIPEKFSTPTAFTITVANLASSTVGVGQQSTLITNTQGYKGIYAYIMLKLGSTTPTGNRFAYVYAIRGDGTTRDDGAGASDAGWTRLNADEVRTIGNKASPAAGDLIYGVAVIENPGPEWGIGIVHDTGVNFDSTGGNHYLYWVGVYPEVQ